MVAFCCARCFRFHSENGNLSIIKQLDYVMTGMRSTIVQLMQTDRQRGHIDD